MEHRAIGTPFGEAISTSWVSRWVSTPTTASTTSASIGTGLVLPTGSGSKRHPPGRQPPSGTSVTGHALHGGQTSSRAAPHARRRVSAGCVAGGGSSRRDLDRDRRAGPVYE